MKITNKNIDNRGCKHRYISVNNINDVNITCFGDSCQGMTIDTKLASNQSEFYLNCVGSNACADANVFINSNDYNDVSMNDVISITC